MIPSVEILIPVFNRKNLILKSVNSALSQTYENISVIVSDNCSSDGTWELLKKIDHPKLKLLRNNKNIGLFANFNELIKNSSKDFTILLCSDDWLEPNFVKKSLKYLTENKKNVMVSTYCRTINEALKIKLTSNYWPLGKYDFNQVIRGWFITCFKFGANPFAYPSGMVLRGDVLRKKIFFDSSIGSPADIVFFLDILKYGQVIFTEYLGANILFHSNQAHKSFQKNGSIINSQIKIIKKYEKILRKMRIYEEVLIFSYIPVIKITINDLFRKRARSIATNYIKNLRLDKINYLPIKILYAFNIRLINFIKIKILGKKVVF
jgi:glycosyltransferase involved in cell wall biosynthesis